MRPLQLLAFLASLTFASNALAQLVAPVVLQSAEPEYPKEAIQQQLTGEVVLTLEIDAEGKVSTATVQQPAGHGFDEAAQAAALRLVFSPARKDGKPVPSRILYKMSFTLKPAPAAPPPPPPTTGILKGHVRLGGTDSPLAGARVILRHANGKTVEVTTGADGSWQVTDLPAGRVVVRAVAAGFKEASAEEQVVAGDEIEVVYRLRPEGAALEVQIRGERPDREITRRTIERKELALVPGTSGDALRAVETMPGVARALPYSGLLVVRGTAPNGTSVFIDGTWVPQIYHFGGLSSVVPTEMIETLDFFPGNFSARYGRAMGGIIDVKTRELSVDGKLHGLAQVDLIDARVMLQGPLPLLRNWSFVAGGRRSHLDAWLPSVMPDEVNMRTAPVYYDYQAFVETKPTSRSLFRFGIFGSDDRLSIVTKGTLDEQNPGFASGFSEAMSFWRLQAMYRNALSNTLSVSATVAYGMQNENMKAGSLSVVDHFHTWSMRGDVTYKPARQVTLRVGPDILYYPYDVDIRAPQPPVAGAPDPGPYATQRLITLEDRGVMSAPAAFAEAEVLPHDRVKLLGGLRMDYFSTNQRVDVSPRFNARYDVGRDPRTTLKAGVGLFYQPPEPVELVAPFGTPTLHSNKSTHYSAGVEQELARNVDVSVEGFYKDLHQLVKRVDHADGSQGYDNIGTGRVYGVETLIRYKPTGRFFGWLAYTMSRSERKDSPDSAERLFEYDQTHILSVLGSYDLGRGWRLGGRFRVVSGNPFTACIGGVLNGAAGSYVRLSAGPRMARAFRPSTSSTSESTRSGSSRTGH